MYMEKVDPSKLFNYLNILPKKVNIDNSIPYMYLYINFYPSHICVTRGESAKAGTEMNPSF